jgi:hypothetical protein
MDKVLCGFVCLVALTAGAGFCHARREHAESWYKQKWCSEHGGITEVRLADGTRCDCVTETHAAEADYGEKWAESVGQSLHYAAVTGRRAGVVLIIENTDECRYLERLNFTIETFQLPIDVWTEGGGLCGHD